MKEEKQYIDQIFWIAILAFSLPFALVVLYAVTLTWLTWDDTINLLLSPVSIVVAVLFIVGVPFFFKSQLQKMVLEAKEGKEELVRKKIYWGQWLYLSICLMYPIGGVFILYSIDFPVDKIWITFPFLVCFNVAVYIPYLVKMDQSMDLLFAHIEIKKDTHFRGIASKIRVTNLMTTFGTLGCLLFAVYMIIKENLSDQLVLQMPLEEIMIRLLIITLVSALFIVIPMIFLGRQLTKQIQNIEYHADLIAGGDLRSNLTRTSSDELGLTVEAVNEMRRDLHVMMQGIQKASQGIERVGDVVQNSSTNLAKESSSQVAYTVDMSNSIEQMTLNIEANSESADQCDVLSSEVGELAQESYDVVLENVNAINEIATKVKVINEIANQTNLLAINATIEAASAGEHGSGFAVVAKEVRTLAEKSKVSAKEINELSNLCLELVQSTQKAINTLKPKSQITAELSSQISKVNKTNKETSIQVNERIHHLNTVAQSNSEISHNLSIQANDLNRQVHILNRLIEEIKV